MNIREALHRFDLDIDGDTVTVYYDVDQSDTDFGYYGGPLLRGVIRSDDTILDLNGYTEDFFERKAYEHYVNNVKYTDYNGDE